MLRPTEGQRALLRGFENTAFDIAETVNRRPALKRVAHRFLRTVGAGWVYQCTRNLLRVYNLDYLTGLRPERGVLLVSNHRSFFDMYVLSCVVLRHTTWPERMYFPVRSDYFYERPDGVVVNALMSAWAMYPPVLRQAERKSFNRYTVDFVVGELGRKGSLVGYHPEGTRNKTDDPYTPLMASPGVGEIIHRARPVVLPAFILGLSNNLPKQVLGNFDGTGDAVTAVFGKPLEFGELLELPEGMETNRKIAERVREGLGELGHFERRMRELERLPPLGPPTR